MKDSIKYDPKYTAEEWADMVYNYEYNHAQEHLAKGAAVDLVLEQMAKRIRDKMILPAIQQIKNSQPTFDATDSKIRYNEIMKKTNKN